jgi:hypothetical protein
MDNCPSTTISLHIAPDFERFCCGLWLDGVSARWERRILSLQGQTALLIKLPLKTQPTKDIISIITSRTQVVVGSNSNVYTSFTAGITAGCHQALAINKSGPGITGIALIVSVTEMMCDTALAPLL